MSPQRRLMILRLAFRAALLFAFVMAVVPHPPQLPGAPSDKIQHISAFLVLGAMGFFAYPGVSRLALGAWLSLFGALIELVQAVPALGRDSDVLDWIADTLAAAVILGLLHWSRGRLIRPPKGETP
jgi:VanZ family protein